MAGEVDAHRIELALELLARHGHRASPALPAIAAVLDHPDPRIEGTGQRVALRARAARAILAIAPECPSAARARAVLAGTDHARASPAVAEHTRRRIEVLLAALATPAQGELAARHLLALGPAGARSLVLALAGDGLDAKVRALALPALAADGALLAELVPELIDLQARLQPAERVPVLDAIAAAAPRSRDVIALPRAERDAAGAPELAAALARVRAVLDLPDWLPGRALADAVLSRNPATMERALDLLAARRVAARQILPDLATALERDYHGTVEVQAGFRTIRIIPVDHAPFLRRRIAETILAIAEPGDPLAARARAILGGG